MEKPSRGAGRVVKFRFPDTLAYMYIIVSASGSIVDKCRRCRRRVRSCCSTRTHSQRYPRADDDDDDYDNIPRVYVYIIVPTTKSLIFLPFVLFSSPSQTPFSTLYYTRYNIIIYNMVCVGVYIYYGCGGGRRLCCTRVVFLAMFRPA